MFSTRLRKSFVAMLLTAMPVPLLGCSGPGIDALAPVTDAAQRPDASTPATDAGTTDGGRTVAPDPSCQETCADPRTTHCITGSFDPEAGGHFPHLFDPVGTGTVRYVAAVEVSDGCRTDDLSAPAYEAELLDVCLAATPAAIQTDVVAKVQPALSVGTLRIGVERTFVDSALAITFSGPGAYLAVEASRFAPVPVRGCDALPPLESASFEHASHTLIISEDGAALPAGSHSIAGAGDGRAVEFGGGWVRVDAR